MNKFVVPAGGTVLPTIPTTATDVGVTYDVTNLEAGDNVIIRIDTRLACGPGQSPTGNLQATLDEASVVGSGDTISTGEQTIPFKQFGSLPDTPTSTVTPIPATSTPPPTNTPTNTATNTPTVTNTPTDTPTNTPTDADTRRPTRRRTRRPTNTPTETPTDTATPTETPTDTPTPTETPTDTATPTETPTDTPTPTETPTDTPTDTRRRRRPTRRRDADGHADADRRRRRHADGDADRHGDPTETPTDTPTPTETPTDTATPTETPTDTDATPTETPTDTATHPTHTPTNTPTRTSTATNTPTVTPIPATSTPVPSEPGTVGYWKNHLGPCPTIPSTRACQLSCRSRWARWADCAITAATTTCSPLMHIDVNTVAEASIILNNTSASDATQKLASQLLAAKLGIKAGTGDGTCLATTIQLSDLLLSTAGYNTKPKNPIRQQILTLATALELWNRTGTCI